MKTRLTLILVLLIYIGAASHTHAQQKKVIKTMMIGRTAAITGKAPAKP